MYNRFYLKFRIIIRIEKIFYLFYHLFIKSRCLIHTEHITWKTASGLFWWYHLPSENPKNYWIFIIFQIWWATIKLNLIFRPRDHLEKNGFSLRATPGCDGEDLGKYWERESHLLPIMITKSVGKSCETDTLL